MKKTNVTVILKKIDDWRNREVEFLLKASGRMFTCSILMGAIEQLIGKGGILDIALLLSAWFCFVAAAILAIGSSEESPENN